MKVSRPAALIVRFAFSRKLRTKFTTLVVSAMCLLAAGVILGFGGRPALAQKSEEDVYREIDRFVEVLQLIRGYYVDETNDEELLRSAVKRMLADLDPHSQFLEEDQYGNLRTGTQGTYSGVGMEVSTRRGYPVVVSPMEGTPAQRAGILTGDLIVAIDGVDTFGLLLEDAVKMLRGEKGTPVVVTVQREGETDRIDLEIIRDVIRIPSTPLCAVMKGDVGYVRVTRYSDQAAVELENCIEGLEAEGVRGLILDFRGNPGGLLIEAVKVCELFVPEGSLLVSTKGRHKSENVEYVSRSRSTRDTIPLVILVNGGTASAAEIVAGAIQDWDLGLILGEPTFGKGSVQRVLSIEDGRALKLTTSYYFTPSGRCIHRGDANAFAGEDGDIGEDGDAEPDSTREYLTAGGRKVFGGGGIMPDVIVYPAEIPRLVRSISGRGLFFSFAVDYVGRHGEEDEAVVTAGTLREFREYLLDEGFPFDEEEFESARDSISLGIRLELTRRLKDDAHARLVAAEADAQLSAAIDLLKKATDRDHLLRLALQYDDGEEK